VVRQARSGRFAVRSVIVGSGEQAEKPARHFREHGRDRIELVGIVDDCVDATCGSTGQENTSGFDEVVRLARGDLVDQAFLAIPWNDVARLQRALARLSVVALRIHPAPDLVGHELFDRNLSPVVGLPMLQLFERPISGTSQFVKRTEDILLATLFLLLAMPVLLVTALAIKLDSPGPVLFRQPPYGFANRLFDVWKFRTLYHELSDSDGTVQVTRKDARITRVGRVLRRFSLDELPQLCNVVRGEVSLVGPRPHAAGTRVEGHLFEDVVDRYAARHKVKPGITGWAQVNGLRGETDTVAKIQRRIEHDLHYIDNWSVWLDLVILMRTVFVLNDDDVY
jgi:Undecaprenyl-phosphate glucose phosphotransferase